ncbi:MAG: zf-HC2 domain-containing protein [bacterium]
MECNKIKTLLSDYIDLELKPGLQSKVEKHISKCPKCNSYLITLQRTIQIYKSVLKPSIPQDVSERLHKRLKEKLPPVRLD